MTADIWLYLFPLYILLALLLLVGVFALLGWTSGAQLPWVVLTSFGLTAAVALSLVAVLPSLKHNDDRDPSIVNYGHHVTAASLLAWVFKSDRLIVGEVLSAPDVALLSIAAFGVASSNIVDLLDGTRVHLAVIGVTSVQILTCALAGWLLIATAVRRTSITQVS